MSFWPTFKRTAFLLALTSCARTSLVGSKVSDPILALSERAPMPHRISIAIPPTGNRTMIKSRMTPLTNYLERELKIPVNLYESEIHMSYEGLFHALRTKAASVAMLSPLAYVEAKERALEVIPLATATGGSSIMYVGYLMVQSGSEYVHLEQLRSKRVAWVDRYSASGYLYPRALIRWRGYDPNTFFGSELFFGDHLSAATAVLNGYADVAAVASLWAEPDSEARFTEMGKLRVIAKTEQIPLDCVVVSGDFPRRLAYRLRTALYTFDQHEALSATLLNHWGIGGFLPVADHQYDEVKRILHSELRPNVLDGRTKFRWNN